MNKKFIKENKKQLREFFSKAIAAIIAAKGTSKIHKAIDKSPELSKKRADLVKHSRDLEKRIKQQIKKATQQNQNQIQRPDIQKS